MNWEMSAVPYWPLRRRIIRRRWLIGIAGALLIGVPLALHYHRLAVEPVGERALDQVTSTIRWRYYDPLFGGHDWNAVVERYKPLVVQAKTEAGRYAALREMIANLADSHTAVYSPAEMRAARLDPSSGVSGAAVGSISGSTVIMRVAPRSPAATAGFRRGLIVAATDVEAAPAGAPREYLLTDPLTGRTWRARLRLAGAQAIENPEGPQVDWGPIARGVGYLRLAAFPDAMAEILGWAMQDVGRQPALVVDLRGNPGGMVDAVDAAAGIFLPPGTLVSTGMRRHHLFGALRFTANDAAGVHYQGRVAVLIDGATQSGAESLAAALQHYRRAVLVGTRTAGKVLGVDAEITLADGGLLRVATLDMRAASGVRLEGVGVTPDVVMRRKPSDIARGQDPQLRAAIKILKRAPTKNL